MEAQLRALSDVDPLTGLLNRRGFEEDRTEKKERQSEASRREIPQKGPRAGGRAGRHGEFPA